jgi:ankyrin repeat protein
MDDFVKAALTDLTSADALLKQHPELNASLDFHIALVLGNLEQVRRALNDSPELLKQDQPLAYVCFSHFAKPSSQRSNNLVETARLLLTLGADPNVPYIDQRWPDNPLPYLYAATGLHNNPWLARVLLDGGAKVDDGESLYHSTEHPDHTCLRLLLEHGASENLGISLKHMLDREDMAGMRILLDAGADPNDRNERGETALHWAVWRGRSAETLAVLLDAGADLNARRSDGRTAYAVAMLIGQTSSAEFLKSRGADTSIAKLEAETDSHLLPDLASVNSYDAVRTLLAAGVPVDTRGGNGGTALHWACWKGYPEMVALLLEHGASVTIQDTTYQGTPAEWLTHGQQNGADADSNHAAVAKLLKIG